MTPRFASPLQEATAPFLTRASHWPLAVSLGAPGRVHINRFAMSDPTGRALLLATRHCSGHPALSVLPIPEIERLLAGADQDLALAFLDMPGGGPTLLALLARFECANGTTRSEAVVPLEVYTDSPVAAGRPWYVPAHVSTFANATGLRRHCPPVSLRDTLLLWSLGANTGANAPAIGIVRGRLRSYL